MEKLTKLIITLCGGVGIGLITYYLVVQENKSKGIEISVKDIDNQNIAKAKVIQDSTLIKISKVLNVDGESFIPTSDKGVYTNNSKDKILVIKEDIWKTMIKNTQKKFPEYAEDCMYESTLTELSNYKFIGLLTNLSVGSDAKYISAYKAIEIRFGKMKSYAGGNVCCDCEGGEPLVAQKIDAVFINK